MTYVLLFVFIKCKLSNLAFLATDYHLNDASSPYQEDGARSRAIFGFSFGTFNKMFYKEQILRGLNLYLTNIHFFGPFGADHRAFFSFACSN